MNEYWFGEKLNVEEYLNNLRQGERVKIECLNLKGELKRINWVHKYFYIPIRIEYPIYEKINFVILNSFVFMDLKINHLKNTKNPELIKYISPESREKEQVIISNILYGTKLANEGIFNIHDIITEVNAKEIKNLNSLQKTIKKPIIKNKEVFISIKGANGSLLIADMKDLLNKNKNVKNMLEIKI